MQNSLDRDRIVVMATKKKELSPEQEKMAPAIGALAGGLYIVNCAAPGETECGFLASWVQQASFDPPMVTVCVNKKRHHLELIQKGGKFTVNVMSNDNKSMGAFFKAPEEGKTVYEGLETFTDKTGVNILKDSVAYIECEYRSEMESADHVVIMAEIVSGGMINEGQEPKAHYRKNGFDY